MPLDSKAGAKLGAPLAAIFQSRVTPFLLSVWRGAVRSAAGISALTGYNERRLAEEALRESEARFRSTFENAAVGIAHAAPNGSWLLVNTRFCEIAGYPREELLAKTFKNVTHPDDVEAERAQLRRIVSGEISSFNIEKRFIRKDGSLIWVRVTVSARKSPIGEIEYYIAVIEDISEQKKAEELERQKRQEVEAILAALEESEIRLRISQEAGLIGSWEWDLASNRLRWSDLQCRRFGVDPALRDNINYKVWRAAVHPEDLERMEALVRKAIEDGKSFDVEYRIVRPGKLSWMNTRGNAIRDANGRPLRLIGLDIDITERKQAEAALQESKQRQEALIQSAMDAIIAIDADQRIILFNPAAERMFGCAAASALGSSIDRFIPERYRQEHREHVKKFGKTGVSSRQMGALSTLWGARDNGAEFPMEASISRIHVNGQRLFTIILRDITERKRHEERARLLMHEVNHRAKNMLAVVQSIARQTAAANAEEFIARFGDRIKALATSQDLLVKNEWKGVNIEALVQSQLAPFQDLIGTRIKLSGAPILLSASAAQTIGMALHELSTNAGKYGAFSNAGGRLEVGWSIERTEDEGEAFVMSWRERDGPPVSAPAQRGFGSTVLSRLVEESLDAEVDLDFAVSGLSWRLRCPAKEAIEGYGFLPPGNASDSGQGFMPSI